MQKKQKNSTGRIRPALCWGRMSEDFLYGMVNGVKAVNFPDADQIGADKVIGACNGVQLINIQMAADFSVNKRAALYGDKLVF